MHEILTESWPTPRHSYAVKKRDLHPAWAWEEYNTMPVTYMSFIQLVRRSSLPNVSGFDTSKAKPGPAAMQHPTKDSDCSLSWVSGQHYPGTFPIF